MARAVTVQGKKQVFRDPTGSGWTGVCIDLWNQTASNLNLTYSLTVLDNYWEMMEHFAANKSDVVIERVNEEVMEDSE